MELYRGTGRLMPLAECCEKKLLFNYANFGKVTLLYLRAINKLTSEEWEPILTNVLELTKFSLWFERPDLIDAEKMRTTEPTLFR